MERLEYFNLFHPLLAKEHQLLLNKLKSKQFSKGDSIIVPGQIQKELYFVNKGVQMSYFDFDQKSHVIAFTYAPNICAIPESFSQQIPSKYFLTCITDSDLEYITFEDLHTVFDQCPSLERLFRKMTETILAGLINRHIELHSLTIEQRYKAFCQRSGHLLHLVPHKYIASYLGIDPTNFSKLYNQIKF